MLAIVAVAMALIVGLLVGRRRSTVIVPEVSEWKGFFCAECGRKFDCQRTLIMHCGAAHPNTYDDVYDDEEGN